MQSSGSTDLFDKAKGLLSRRVALKVINESGLPLQIVAWPARNPDSPDRYELLPFRGSEFDGTVHTTSTLTEREVELGSMRVPHKISTTTHWGWINFDLIKPDQTRLHLQAFLHLSRSGIETASVGRLDIDSDEKNPQQSGEAGSATFKDRNADVVEYILGTDVVDMMNETNDAVTGSKAVLPGKKIEASSYVSVPSGKVSLLVGKDARYHECLDSDDRSIRTTIHSVEGLTKRPIAIWGQDVENIIFEGHASFNPLTTGKALVNTRESTTVFSEDGSVQLAYGFAGQGEGRRDRLYAYVSPGSSDWIGDLIRRDDRWRNVPFSRLVLPAAHDSGMFMTLDPGLFALIQSGKLGDAMGHKAVIEIGTPVVHALIRLLEHVKLKPDRIILNIGKPIAWDPFPSQLRVGTRFFDMRPGYCFYDVIKLQKGDIHHQHAMVPGERYEQFLVDVLQFLVEHPWEIVVVELKSDGFVLKKDVLHDGQVTAYSMVPDEAELAACLHKARKSAPAADDVQIGSAKDLDEPIGKLIDENRRFIMIDKIHHPDDWPRSDSYDHVAYNTEDPTTIIAALEKTYTESSVNAASIVESPGKPKRGCIYQFQATPTSNIADDLISSITFSDCSSLLVWSKPRQDRETYPWIAGKKFDEPGNVVLLNDFIDGALVQLAIRKSWERAGF